MTVGKSAIACLISAALVLSGCVTNSGSRSESIGPLVSSVLDRNRLDRVASAPKQKLDVVIPIFDPGLEGKNAVETTPGPFGDDDEAQFEEDDEVIWAELRRAEAVRFAYKLKAALDDTGRFGAVRVTPDRTATSDLYVLGKIEQSNGAEVEIDIEVYDISGARWYGKSFDHEVEEGFHKNLRNKGKDPYDPVFEDAAAFLTKETGYYEPKEFETLARLSDLRFAASFAEEAFASHLERKNGVYVLHSYPSSDDPMLRRTRAIRVRDKLFVDNLQDNYREFSQNMDESYAVWQEQSQLELEAEKAAKRKAAGQTVLGLLVLGVAVAAVAAGADTDSISSATAATTAGVVAGVVGASLLESGFQTSKEAKVHRDALEELGDSIDQEIAPEVIKFEEQTVELQGTASEQFAQWRGFLKRIFEQELTPDKVL
jgi:hypothetical protein